MTTFTLYRADVRNDFESGSIAVFDTFYYLDGDMTNWDTQDEYELPKGWRFEDGGGEDFSYLVTDTGEVIEGQNISHYETEDAPGTWCKGNSGMTKVVFKKIDSDA